MLSSTATAIAAATVPELTGVPGWEGFVMTWGGAQRISYVVMRLECIDVLVHCNASGDAQSERLL